MNADNSSREYHPLISFVTNAKFQVVFALVALCVIIVYSSSIYIFPEYPGAWLLPGEQEISEVDKGGPADEAGIQVGDKLLAVDGQPFDWWFQRPSFRPGIDQGEVVTFEIQRGDQRLSVPVVMETIFDHPELLAPLYGTQVLALVFWLLGLSLCIFVPANDVRARLVGLAWLLIGAAVASGGTGAFSSFWGARTVMKFAWSWLICVGIIAHLYFPVPSFSSRRRQQIVSVLFALASLLVITNAIEDWAFKPQAGPSPHWGLVLDRGMYVLLFMSIVINIGLLFRNRFLTMDPDVRRQTGIVMWGMVFGFAPFFALTVLPGLLFGIEKEFIGGAYSALFLILVPLSYAYIIHQRKLLRVDFIINRMVVFFVMILLVLLFSFSVLGAAALIFRLPSQVPVFGALMAVVVTLPSAAIQGKVNEQVNRVLYGAHYDHTIITSNISGQLARALDLDTLVNLLTNSLAQQMGIKQSALLLLDGEDLKLQPWDGDIAVTICLDDELCLTLLDAQAPVRAQHLWGLLSTDAQQRWQEFIWGQLFAPIIFEGRLYGILTLGDRVAGEVYSEQDVKIIATVAHQGALATANVQLVEELRGLTRQLVRAGETERKKVARDLHDGVLQNLYFIRQSVPQNNEELIGHIGDTIANLRQSIKAQRPDHVDRGLVSALQDLVNDMRKLAGERGPKLVCRNTAGVVTQLPDEEITAIYRIVQEAVSNALRHAQARNIIVAIEQKDDALLVFVEDDGVGMPQTLASEGCYGLVGMRERAIMIGAHLEVLSNPGMGTRIALEMGKKGTGRPRSVI